MQVMRMLQISGRNILLGLGVSLGMAIALPVQATFHLWTLTEVYSNADGSMQFIEMTTNSSSENFLSGHTVVSQSNSGGSTTFTFNGNLPGGSTANRRLLLATQQFVNSTGLAADYIIPENFVPMAGGTLNFVGFVFGSFSFSREQLPRNGLQSINASRQPQSASPVNFSGMTTGSLPTVIAGEVLANFDATTNVLNLPVLNAPGIGVGNVSFAVDLNNLTFTLLEDFFLYGAGIEAGGNAAQFQNGTVLYVPALPFGNEIFEFNLTLINDDPITFGEPQILSVTAQ